MADKTLSAGDPIETRCTKCRKKTNHIVIAMLDDIPAKVKCNTCDGEHKYRPPAKRKAPAVRRSVDPKLAEKKEWAKLQPEIENQPATAYSMKAALKNGDIVKHPTFGLGLVQDSIGLGKVEILFEDGKKKMCCK
jgi:hypothetical protein